MSDPQAVVERLLKQAGSKKSGDIESLQDYLLRGELGKGGMGAVYLLEHPRTKDRLALKIMLPHISADEGARRLFLREAENTKSLQHRNVARLRVAGSFEDVLFMALEYCNEGSVAELMERQGGHLSVETSLEIILQALDGLEYAHHVEVSNVRLADGTFGSARGVVHRDIKPQNLLLTKEGGALVAKLGDYGLAKAFDLAGLSGVTLTGRVGGTIAFMPRQQIINYKYAKPEVDVWAMAATLYNMLTGWAPREFTPGSNPVRVVLDTNAVPIRQREPSITPRLAKAIDEALIDEPGIKIKTAREFKQALMTAAQLNL